MISPCQMLRTRANRFGDSRNHLLLGLMYLPKENQPDKSSQTNHRRDSRRLPDETFASLVHPRALLLKSSNRVNTISNAKSNLRINPPPAPPRRGVSSDSPLGRGEGWVAFSEMISGNQSRVLRPAQRGPVNPGFAFPVPPPGI